MKFVRAYVEVTNVCGLACTFCPPKSQPTVTMSLPFFEEVLHQLRPYTEEIAMHVMGDPMVLSNLDEYLDIAHRRGMKVMITTSGFYLDPSRRAQLFLPAVRQVNLSLNSFNKNSVSRSFEEYLAPHCATRSRNTKGNFSSTCGCGTSTRHKARPRSTPPSSNAWRNTSVLTRGIFHRSKAGRGRGFGWLQKYFSTSTAISSGRA